MSKKARLEESGEENKREVSEEEEQALVEGEERWEEMEDDGPHKPLWMVMGGKNPYEDEESEDDEDTDDEESEMTHVQTEEFDDEMHDIFDRLPDPDPCPVESCQFMTRCATSMPRHIRRFHPKDIPTLIQKQHTSHKARSMGEINAFLAMMKQVMLGNFPTEAGMEKSAIERAQDKMAALEWQKVSNFCCIHTSRKYTLSGQHTTCAAHERFFFGIILTLFSVGNYPSPRYS